MPSRRRHPFSWRTHPWRFFAVVLLLVLSLAGASRFAVRLFEPQPSARWIWADGDYSAAEPIAFYAVRDIEVPAPGPGRITIAADETYLLYLNSQRLGAGSYRDASAFDVYDVGDFLVAGVNRVLIEVRSSRGAGGLIAKLDLAGDTIVTDDEWRIFRHFDAGLVRGWSNLTGGEAPRIWARAPTGRWRLNGARQRTIPFQHFLPPGRSWPVRHHQYHSGSWSPLSSQQRRIPALGPQQVFDWGAEVTGYLSFDLRSGDSGPGLLYVSAEPPDSARQPPDEVIIPVPGRRFWEDAHPRRFRYVLLVGAEPYSRIEVDLLDGEAGDTVVLRENNHDGVFGIEPPRSYSRVEEKVYGRLQEEADKRASM